MPSHTHSKMLHIQLLNNNKIACSLTQLHVTRQQKNKIQWSPVNMVTNGP